MHLSYISPTAVANLRSGSSQKWSYPQCLVVESPAKPPYCQKSHTNVHARISKCDHLKHVTLQLKCLIQVIASWQSQKDETFKAKFHKKGFSLLDYSNPSKEKKNQLAIPIMHVTNKQKFMSQIFQMKRTNKICSYSTD